VLYKITMLVRPINRSSVLTDTEVEESFQFMVEKCGAAALAREIGANHAEVGSYEVERIN
jgi:hypothetical protein